jgi:hypothetical protein
MGDTGQRPLSSHDAERIRREWAAGRADLDDVTRALDQLVHALGALDRAARVIQRLAEGPWPTVRHVVRDMEAWLKETDPPPIKPVEPRRRW